MDHHAGIDVSLEASSICVVDGTGKIVREMKVASEPEALIGLSDGRSVSRCRARAGELQSDLFLNHARLSMGERQSAMARQRVPSTSLHMTAFLQNLGH